MTNISNNIKKYFGLIIWIFIILIILYTNVFLKYPLKNTEDTWHYLASIAELKKDYNFINDPFFIEGPKDQHFGPYLISLAITSNLTGVDHVKIYLWAGIFNVIFLMSALYYFYKTLYASKIVNNSEALIFVLFCLISWGSNSLSYSGYFSISDLILNGAAPANFGLGIAIIIASLIIKKEYKKIIGLIVIQLLSVCLFLTHPLTGIMLFLIIGAHISTEIINQKKIELDLIYLALTPIITFLLSLLWPYYSVYDFFFHKTQFIHTIDHVTPLSIQDWPSIIGLGIISLIFLFRSQNLFLIIWIFGFFLVSISYLTPWQISLYWRFLPLLIIPGLALFYRYLFQSNQKRSNLLLIIAIVIFGLVNTYSKFSYRSKWPSYTINKWSYIKNLNEKDVLLTDPFTGYISSGLYGVNVVATREGHRNALNEVNAIERETDLNKFFTQDLNTSEIESLIETYKVTYILTNEEIGNIYNWRSNKNYFDLHFEKVFNDEKYTVYHIK